jgi:hypothetical protein
MEEKEFPRLIPWGMHRRVKGKRTLQVKRKRRFSRLVMFTRPRKLLVSKHLPWSNLFD